MPAKKPLALGTRGGGPAGAGVVAPGSVRGRRHYPGAGSKGLGPARQTGTLIPFAFYNLAMVGTFLGLFTAFTSEQEAAYLAIFRSNYWAGAFPPLTEPLKLAGWLAEAHTGRMFAYPFGEARGGSSLTTLCFTVALVALWRRRQFALIVLALGPFGLAFVASVLGRYPYGGSARTMIFVAPMICLLSGLGLAVMIGRLRLARMRRLAVLTTAFGLAMTGIVMLGLKVAFPYKSIPDQNSRDVCTLVLDREGPRLATGVRQIGSRV